MIYIACDASVSAKKKVAIAYTVFNSITGTVQSFTEALSYMGSGNAEFVAFTKAVEYAKTLNQETMIYTDQEGIINLIENGTGKLAKAKAVQKLETIDKLLVDADGIHFAKVKSHNANELTLAQALHRIADGEAAKAIRPGRYKSHEHYEYLERVIPMYSKQVKSVSLVDAIKFVFKSLTA